MFRTCGDINDLKVVSLISNLCVMESTKISNPQLLNGFIISWRRSLTEISINIFGKKYFWLYSGLKNVTTSLDMHDGVTLGWDSIHSTIYSLNSFIFVLYLKQCLIDFRVIFSISDTHVLIFCPLLTKLRAELRQRLVSLIKCFLL